MSLFKCFISILLCNIILLSSCQKRTNSNAALSTKIINAPCETLPKPSPKGNYYSCLTFEGSNFELYIFNVDLELIADPIKIMGKRVNTNWVDTSNVEYLVLSSNSTPIPLAILDPSDDFRSHNISQEVLIKLNNRLKSSPEISKVKTAIPDILKLHAPEDSDASFILSKIIRLVLSLIPEELPEECNSWDQSHVDLHVKAFLCQDTNLNWHSVSSGPIDIATFFPKSKNSVITTSTISKNIANREVQTLLIHRPYSNYSNTNNEYKNYRASVLKDSHGVKVGTFSPDSIYLMGRRMALPLSNRTSVINRASIDSVNDRLFIELENILNQNKQYIALDYPKQLMTEKASVSNDIVNKCEVDYTLALQISKNEEITRNDLSIDQYYCKRLSTAHFNALLIENKKPKGFVFYFGGGPFGEGLSFQQLNPYIFPFVDNGWSVILVDYSSLGKSSNEMISFNAKEIELFIHQELKLHSKLPSKCLFLGTSFGANAALTAATTSQSLGCNTTLALVSPGLVSHIFSEKVEGVNQEYIEETLGGMTARNEAIVQNQIALNNIHEFPCHVFVSQYDDRNIALNPESDFQNRGCNVYTSKLAVPHEMVVRTDYISWSSEFAILGD